MNKTKNKRKILISTLIIINFLFFKNINQSEANYNYQIDSSNGISENIREVRTIYSDTVYHLDHKRKIKKAYNNERAFFSYGHELKDVFLVEKEALDKWKNVKLIKTAKNEAVYYVSGNKIALIESIELFNEYNFNWNEIITVNPIDFSTYTIVDFYSLFNKKEILEEEKLYITLDKKSPKKKNIAINTKNNLLAIFNLKSSNCKEKILIKNINIKLKGLYNKDLIEKVRIRDEDNYWYYDDALIEDKISIFNLNSKPLKIEPNKERRLGIYVDFKDGDATHQDIWASIENLDYIDTETNIEGVFPIEGALSNLINPNDTFAEAKIEQIENSPSQIIIGNRNQVIANYKITELSENEDILLKSITFKNIGTANKEDIIDIKLKDDDNFTLAQTNFFTTKKEVILKLDGEYLIEKGEEKNISVQANIASGVNKTIKLELEDIELRGQEYNFGINTEIKNNIQTTIINREKINIIPKNFEEINNNFSQKIRDLENENKAINTGDKIIVDEETSIVGAFTIANNYQKIILDNIEFELAKSDSAPELSTVYLINYENGEIIDYSDINKTETFYLNQINIEPEKDLTLVLLAKISKKAQDGDIYQISLKNISYTAEVNNEKYDIEDRFENLKSEQIEVKSSSAYLYSENESDEEIVIIKGKKALLAKFKISLDDDSDENVIIKKITLNPIDTSANLTYANGIDNIQLKVGTKSITHKKPKEGKIIFDGINKKLKGRRNLNLRIYADINSEAKINESQFILTVDAVEEKTGKEISIGDLTSSKIKFGDLFAELKIIQNNPSENTEENTSGIAGQVIKGRTNNLLGQFEVKNTGDKKIAIKKIQIGEFAINNKAISGLENLKIETNEKTGRKKKIKGGYNKISKNFPIEVGETKLFKIYCDADESLDISDDFDLRIKLEGQEYKSNNGKKVKVKILGDINDKIKVNIN